MNWQRIVIPVAGAAFVVGAWRSFGWPGVALAAGAIFMWVLLHFTRLMHVLKAAADRPIGHVASAVMLNARLRPGVTLMHVVAMTRALGEQLSPQETQPEVFRWTDSGGSHVTCEFLGGKLTKWELVRPPEDAGPDRGPHLKMRDSRETEPQGNL
jgi:hypothetical protein